ncbi:ABC transporter ATP-binding protein [Peribacillus psychrosaccharolyticus]|uniref:ABC transporter ATP-binding protein n=1 Tax=Peribacillus psychrosaccharolyticus TaxID=1407 RepID=A0A974NR93_PERPY|nr:ABC transporter ATP-binding protein [Peribacillus psychrosaccharolyticus]MEC2057058.1 ABC transporter ATP-binding protein [Peribacillus psychrosaccharolyticus]MED3744980.1 ABC transporter ATP-binding protein [Peribacillus psychrosaccharolyticus]QQT02403.1 ABC transporter ATP-binding protein [Peribacillus psychrosaccharolyticus]
MTYIIQTNQLTKSYKESHVVSNVNMKVKKGEIYGFLGPNGAGKTTVMKMLTGLVKPTGGSIEIFGEKLTETSYDLFARMGSIIEYPVFYDKLTAKENLALHGEYMGYYDKQAIDEALKLVGLTSISQKSVKEFSLGMKQRLGIARAIMTKPQLLILDEPINGLDPVGIKELRSLFQMLCHEYEMTLLISSHILGEIELIADTIGVIKEGRLIEEVSMKDIRDRNTEYIELSTEQTKKAVYVLEEILAITNYKLLDDSIIRIYSTEHTQRDISKALILNDVSIEALSKKNHSLEDYFLSLINGGGLSA